MDWISLEKQLKKELSEDRYRHTLAVMYTAINMAYFHGADPYKARLAGLLHDCAKCISNKKKIQMCDKAGLDITEFEREHPVLLHAKLGAYLARKEYEVEDDKVLSAIRWHTTGKANMSLLDKIVFAADYLEPNRDKAPNLEKIRQLAYRDLDLCVYEILKDTIAYLSKNPKSMDTTTLNAFAYYEELAKQKTETADRQTNPSGD